MNRFMRDVAYDCSNRDVASIRASHGVPVYLYHLCFDYTGFIQNDIGHVYLCFHVVVRVVVCVVVWVMVCVYVFGNGVFVRGISFGVVPHRFRESVVLFGLLFFTCSACVVP